MATETHIDIEAASGSLQNPPPFKDNTRVVLMDSGGSIFLQFGASGCADSQLSTVALTDDQAKQLCSGLKNALVSCVRSPFN